MLYRTDFERFNFLFTPAAKQKVDIFFEYDGDEDDLVGMEEAAWDALHKQFPQCAESNPFPVEGYGGWGSWMGGRKIEKVELDLDLDLGTPGDGKPRIGEIIEYTDMRGKINTGRVDSFYKTWTPPKRKENKHLDEILAEIMDEEYDNMTAEQRRWRDIELKVVPCSREEAELVGCSGVAWAYRRIEDVKVTGLVKWDVRTIAKERERWGVRCLREENDPTTLHKYWELHA